MARGYYTAWRVQSITVLLAAAFVVLAAPASAQKYQVVGRGKCVGCHDHDNEKLWSEKKDGPPPNNHLNALKQMENAKTKDFAKAVGVTDPYDPGSSCVRCHATVLKGDVSGGVTCETCHGPGSGYLDPHQKKDSYAQSVALGMTDAVKKPAAWAVLCMRCHVMDDAKLIAAKHPSGDDFDLGAKFGVVATGHWKSTYGNKGEISALGKAEATKIIAARKGGAVAPPPATVPPATVPPVTTPPATAPPATSPPATQPAQPGQRTNPPATAPPTTVVQSAPQRTVPRATQPPATVAPQVARGPDTAITGLPTRTGTPPSPPVTDLTADPMAAMTPGAMTAMALLLPQSPTAAVAAIQGRAIALLDSLLRRSARAPLRVVPSERKTEYRGPDADLLRLQNEVLSLALEALRTAPPANAAPANK